MSAPSLALVDVSVRAAVTKRLRLCFVIGDCREFVDASTYLNTLVAWKRDIVAATKARDVALITEALKV